MRYKVGDKVRVRGDLEYFEHYGDVLFSKNMGDFRNEIAEVIEERNGYHGLSIDNRKYAWSDEMLRPAEFKIWCNTEVEKQAVLEELEKEGYKDSEKINEVSGEAPVGFFIEEDNNYSITFSRGKGFFGDVNIANFTPSEFIGIDFSEKIIITKTTTGASATYGDKTVTTEGEFEDASRQALAEVLCPFKVGDKVVDKRCKNIVTKIRINGEVVVHLDDEDGDYDMTFNTLELLEPYTEPSYNAKLFCVKGSNDFEQGRIYEVENGMLKINHHKTRWVSLEDINSYLHAQFMEVKDD